MPWLVFSKTDKVRYHFSRFLKAHTDGISRAKTWGNFSILEKKKVLFAHD